MENINSSRRRFLKQNLLASSGAMLLGSMGSCGLAPNKSTSTEDSSKTNEKIGNMNLEQLRDQSHDELFKRFIPNMDSLVIDHDLGGFMCDLDISARKLVSTKKSAWYEGRGMWVYSFLYNNFGKDPHYLEIARKSKDFILPHLPSDDSFFIAGYTKEGKPLSTSEGDIYCSLFVAEGLAEFSKASGEEQYLQLAKKITLSALARYDRLDYKYRISYGPPGAPEISAPRVNGHWMIFLRSATQFLEQGEDPDIQKLADRCVDAIMNHHLNPHYKLINEGLNHDLTLPDNAWAQFSYLGHGLETLWMVMAEAIRRKDRSLFDSATEAFKRHVEVANDPVYGGSFTGLDQVDNAQFKLNKVLWEQEEALNGTMILIEHTDDAWARERFAKTYAYIKDKYAYPEYAFPVESGDRQMAEHTTHRAENYHHPRRLMLNLLALERIIKRKGKVPESFS